MVGRFSILCFAASALVASTAPAVAENLLVDRNNDGAVEILAFGDSITYGVGDQYAPGDYVEQIYDAGDPGGYPLRLSSILGVSVENAGVPGEELITAGIFRFIDLMQSSSADTVIFKEGVNDSVHLVDAQTYSITVQTAINVARAQGKTIVVSTLAPPTQMHASLEPYTAAYSSSIRELVILNSVPLVDLDVMFRTACPILSTCSYYNLPEGLHPNSLGYDAIASTMANAFTGGSNQ